MQDFIKGLNGEQLENLKEDLQKLENNINVPQNGQSMTKTRIPLATAIANKLKDQPQGLSQYLAEVKQVNQTDKLFKDGEKLAQALELAKLQSQRNMLSGTSLTNLPQVIESINGEIKNRAQEEARQEAARQEAARQEAATKIQAAFRGKLGRKEAAAERKVQEYFDQFDVDGLVKERQEEAAERKVQEYFDQFDVDGLVKERQEEALTQVPGMFVEAEEKAMLKNIKIAFEDYPQDQEEFFKKVLGAEAYNTIKGNKADLKTLEKGFKALKANYPDGKITDNFEKVQNNENFKDFLKICLIVVTLGVAALFDATTLQSTHKKNYDSFTKLVEEKNKNSSQGHSIS